MNKRLLLLVALLSPLGAVTHVKGMLLAAGAVMTNKDAPIKKLRIGETYSLSGYSPEKYTVGVVGNKKAIKVSKTKDGKAFEVTALKPCTKHDEVGVTVTKKGDDATKAKRVSNFVIAFPDLNSLPNSFKEGDHVLVARTKEDQDSVQTIKSTGADKGVARVSASKRYFSIKMQEDGQTMLHGHDDNDNKIHSKEIVVYEKDSDDRK